MCSAGWALPSSAAAGRRWHFGHGSGRRPREWAHAPAGPQCVEWGEPFLFTLYNSAMTKKILIVRTSSLGDLVHMLPAISDIARHVPGACIDWVVEENFAEVPSWHPAVNEVIPVAHRRWRKSWWSPQTREERARLRRNLGGRRYDVVLDMQGLMKSIWLVRQTHGERHGLDRRSAREPLASLFYDVRHSVEFWQPAVIRQRKLAASVFGYEFEGEPDFGLGRFTEGG